MRAIVPITLSIVVTACSQAVISSPGKSDDALRADMSACNAGSLSLHDRSVINCLNTHGDTITYGDETIPPYTDANPHDVAMTAAEVQKRQAAADVVLKRWQTAQNSNQPTGVSQTSAPSPAPEETTTFITDSMYEDLKEVVHSNGLPMYPNGISDVPNQIGLRAQTVGNFFFWRNHDNGNNQDIHWGSNKDMQDFVKAKRWYQFALSKETSPALRDQDLFGLKNCNFALSNESGSARSEIAEEKRQEQENAEEQQRKLNLRKKVGDCILVPGGTGLFGLSATMATVTAVSGNTLSWTARLHRNGYTSPGIFGGVNVYHAPIDFDRDGTIAYNEVTLCN